MQKRTRKKVFGFFGISGAGTLLLGFVFLSALLAVIAAIDNEGGSQSYPDPDSLELSQAVLAHADTVRYYAELEGIPEYTYLLLCIMQQESGGQHIDLMQASECKFNTKYLPRSPNAIKDSEYSIEVGVRNFADCLEISGGAYPFDIEVIKLALQSYNFGQGYSSWAISNYGGYNYENAVEFSRMQNPNGYGDVNYVGNVLQYYNSDEIPNLSGGSSELVYPLQSIKITSPYGQRTADYHRGVDFAASIGTSVYASADGTVIDASYRYDWGNYVKISHGNGVYTLYAHLQSSSVEEGQQIKQGQRIGFSGATGNVTGPHLHFELYIGGPSAANKIQKVRAIPHK